MNVTLFHRWIVVATLLFWQGGGVFYATVGIAIGRRILREEIHLQNAITQDVTNWLNRIGAVALPILAWELKWRRFASRWHWLLWGMLAGSVATLMLFHTRLVDQLDLQSSAASGSVRFQLDHALYLVVSVLQAGVSLIYLGVALAAWRSEDKVG